MNYKNLQGSFFIFITYINFSFLIYRLLKETKYNPFNRSKSAIFLYLVSDRVAISIATTKSYYYYDIYHYLVAEHPAISNAGSHRHKSTIISYFYYDSFLKLTNPNNTYPRMRINQCLPSGRHNQAAGFLVCGFNPKYKNHFIFILVFLFWLYVFF